LKYISKKAVLIINITMHLLDNFDFFEENVFHCFC
jgi:hypothetical protein